MKAHASLRNLASVLLVASLSASGWAATTTTSAKTDKAPAAKTEKAASATAAGKTPAERRQHIKDTVNATATRPITVTSEHRDNSAAHRRGAIDIRSKDISTEARHTEARQISKALGKDHTVVVEEVHRVDHKRGQHGPEAQVNTAYRDGNKGSTRTMAIPKSDSATHTHIQPEVPAKKK